MEPKVEAGDRALETARKILDLATIAPIVWCEVSEGSTESQMTKEIAALIQSAIDAQEREPKSLWLWPIEEIKSAMRQFQSAHPGKMPSEVEAERLLAERGEKV